MQVLISILALVIVLALMSRVAKSIIHYDRKPFYNPTLMVREYGDEVGVNFSCRAITWLSKFNEVLEMVFIVDLALMAIVYIL